MYPTEGNDVLTGTADADIIDGLGGDDVLLGNEGDDQLSGGDGMDLLVGGPGDDILDGGEGDDAVGYSTANAGVSVDLSAGTAEGEGSDTLLGIEAVAGSQFDDVLIGDAGSNMLSGDAGDDVIEGGGGDDWLGGGEGGDTFKYSFSTGQQQTQESFTGWLADLGLSLEDTSQSFFASNYTGYLQYLVDKYDLGLDLNGDGKIQVGINQNDPSGVPTIEGMSGQEIDAFGDATSIDVITGKTTHVRWYSDSFSINGGGEALASADGSDDIVGFNLSVDTLDFSGLGEMALETFDELFDVTLVNGDTVIALAESSDWSVTLVGVTADVEDVYDVVKFT